MTKKKALFEDEIVIPPEENNCFAFNKECQILTDSKMTNTDMLNCGTLNCPFYKPEEHKNSIKHIGKKRIYFETREEYMKRTGHSYLTIENADNYNGPGQVISKLWEK